MTDDELLTLARKATQGEHVAMDARTLSAPATCIDFAVVAGNRETARVWTEDDARYYAAANPAAIIALIERHRAEVEREEAAHCRTIAQRDEAEECVSSIYFGVIGASPEWSNLFGYEQAQEEIIDTVNALKSAVKTDRAEVERLTREHEETLAAVRATISRLMDEHEAAESALATVTRERDDYKDDYFRRHKDACDRYEKIVVLEFALAAAQKRVEVLEAAHRKIIEQQRGMWAVSPAMIARAALKESGT